MLAAIWQGAGQASDVFLLIAAILAGLSALAYFIPPSPRAVADGVGVRSYAWGAVLLSAAVCCFCIGFLAL